MKYLFILGRNIQLSLTEIESYLEKKKNKIIRQDLIKNALLIELDKEIDFQTIDFLGGTIAIGKVNCNIEEKDLDKIEIYNGKSNKFNYIIWDFSNKTEKIRKYLKNRFKKEKLKTTEKHLTKSINMQEKKNVNIPSSKLLDKEFFVFKNDFGEIIQKCDYNSIEKRDMEKPIRRESLAISPRLGKIIINLSQTEENQTLLDPFCGIGTILQEALLQKIKVIGIDKDKDAIENAKKNLSWFKFPKENYILINQNSSKVKIPEVHSIATEPDLGQILKKIPTEEQATKTLKEFENLMISTINNLKSKIEHRIVFTSPYIKTAKKRISCNIERICNQTNYKMIKKPIPEFRENNLVGRMIYILEKNN